MSSNQHVALDASTRQALGHMARKLVRQNILPAVVYSRKVKSQPIQISLGEFRKAFKESGKTHVIDLKIDGKVQACLVHDLDIHPVTGQVRHVDFLAVNLREKITTTVPVNYVGVPIGVKEVGGVLTTMVDELEVTCLPDKIPEEITVDVTELKEIGDTIRLEDIIKAQTTKEFEIVADDVEMVLASLTREKEVEEESPTPETVVLTGGAEEEGGKKE